MFDVYVVGRARAESFPIIIGSRYPAEEFVDILTHEVLHGFFTDHAEEGDLFRIMNEDEKFMYEWRLTKSHILVHALHAYLFLEVLKDPARLARDVDASSRFPPAYKRAWDIVGEWGYNEVINYFVEHPKWPKGNGADACA